MVIQPFSTGLASPLSSFGLLFRSKPLSKGMNIFDYEGYRWLLVKNVGGTSVFDPRDRLAIRPWLSFAIGVLTFLLLKDVPITAWGDADERFEKNFGLSVIGEERNRVLVKVLRMTLGIRFQKDDFLMPDETTCFAHIWQGKVVVKRMAF